MNAVINTDKVRYEAIKALLQVQKGRKLPTAAMAAKAGTNWTQTNMNFFNELTHGVCRKRNLLDAVIRRCSNRSLEAIDAILLEVLRVGVYQFFYMNSVPGYAVVNESVKIAMSSKGRGAAGFVNAVLRKAAKEDINAFMPEKLDSIRSISLAYSHPRWMIRRWSQHFNLDAAAEICRFNNSPASMHIRVDSSKIDRDEFIEKIREEGFGAEKLNSGPEAVVLDKGSGFTETTLFKGGYFTVQDEMSQLMPLLLKPEPGGSILDACAGKGSKTLHMVQMIASNGKVVAADMNPGNLKLMENEEKRMKYEPVQKMVVDWTKRSVTQNNIMYFDHILFDAPCSGLGVLHRHPDIRWNRKKDDISKAALIQKQIGKNLITRLKSGGTLLYCVCCYEPEETFSIVESLMQSEQLELVPIIPEIEGRSIQEFITPDGFFLSLPYPHKTSGYFAALFRKTK